MALICNSKGAITVFQKKKGAITVENQETEKCSEENIQFGISHKGK